MNYSKWLFLRNINSIRCSCRNVESFSWSFHQGGCSRHLSQSDSVSDLVLGLVLTHPFMRINRKCAIRNLLFRTMYLVLGLIFTLVKLIDEIQIRQQFFLYHPPILPKIDRMDSYRAPFQREGYMDIPVGKRIDQHPLRGVFTRIGMVFHVGEDLGNV